jgi:hypothetical protein
MRLCASDDLYRLNGFVSRHRPAPGLAGMVVVLVVEASVVWALNLYFCLVWV